MIHIKSGKTPLKRDLKKRERNYGVSHRPSHNFCASPVKDKVDAASAVRNDGRVLRVTSRKFEDSINHVFFRAPDVLYGALLARARHVNLRTPCK